VNNNEGFKNSNIYVSTISRNCCLLGKMKMNGWMQRVANFLTYQNSEIFALGLSLFLDSKYHSDTKHFNKHFFKPHRMYVVVLNTEIIIASLDFKFLPRSLKRNIFWESCRCLFFFRGEYYFCLHGREIGHGKWKRPLALLPASLAHSLTLRIEIEVAHSSRTLKTIFHTTGRNIPENNILQKLHPLQYVRRKWMHKYFKNFVLCLAI
jgi:hypothetical protein